MIQHPTPRIVFFGTPEFAVQSLHSLIQQGYNIVGVVTTPDLPGKRQKDPPQPSAVKAYALEHNLPLLQPVKLRDPEFLQALQAWQADLQIVVAFRMLPQLVWDMPPMGTFNLHAALLPQYRGAAPINWAIINGETETGVTTFLLTHEIDTGAIIMQRKEPIHPTDTAGDLYNRLMLIGADMVIDTVQALVSGTAHPVPQPDTLNGQPLLPAPKIFKDTCHINWHAHTTQVCNHIRGLAPSPAAYSNLCFTDGTRLQLKVFLAEPVHTAPACEPGTPLTDGRTYLHIATTDGYISLLEVQLTGKRRMPIRDFLNGLHNKAFTLE